MTVTACPSVEQLRALSLGQLPDEQSDDLFAHIHNCEACSAELDSVNDQDDSLIADLRSPDHLLQLDSEPGCPVAVAKALEALPLLAASPERTAFELARFPKIIGEYELVRPLGQGGMGSVFLAQHTKLGRQVAVKFLVSHRLANARMRERFEAEMRAVGQLSHPNIVNAHDAREVDGTAVLVTEFIDGLDLGQLIQRTGPLAIADACELARQVAIALQYTGQLGFVHRDVKPSNIMLSRTGEVKLLDLGLARLQFGEGEQADITGTGQALGTADYIAPEQVTDSRSVDVRADIYSLGCTLFKLLTVQAPFADNEHITTFAKMTAHVSKQPPSLTNFLPDAPAGLVKLLGSMLAKSPEDRPQEPQVVVERLSAHNSGADLQQLAQRAISLPTVQLVSRPLTSPCRSVKTQSFWKRPISKTVVVAAGLFGMLLGFCLGIIITITNPDGTKTLIELAAGSKVELSQTENETVTSSPSTFDTYKSSQAGKIQWLPYDEANLQAERRAGRPVVLLFTARWSLRCQAVKQLLENDIIASRIKEFGMVAMEADWTESAESIRLKLESLGANSVPLLAVYPADIDTQAIVIKDPVTEERVLQALGQTARKTTTTHQAVAEQPTQVSSAPLQFGLLVNRQDSEQQPKIDVLTLNEITDLLHMSDSSTPIQLGTFQFCSIARDESDNYPIVVWNNGWPYTLVSTDPLYSVGWGEIHGRILSLNTVREIDSDDTTINVTFDKTLGDKMERLTARAIQKNLAVIVDNRIFAAPQIRSAINTEVQITGAFSSAQLTRLRQGTASMQIPNVTEVTTSTPPLQSNLDSIYWHRDGRLALEQMGRAFSNFENAMKVRPGSTNMSRSWGKAYSAAKYPCSWRVGILPFINEMGLYEQYHFDEPWDSKHNLTLVEKMPKIYRSSSAPEGQPAGNTNFLGFSGDKSALGDNGVPLSDILDGPSSTLLLVETKHSIPWTKPEDFPFADYEDAKQAIPFDNQGLHYLTVDGNVYTMFKPIDWHRLGRLITRNGGETVKMYRPLRETPDH